MRQETHPDIFLEQAAVMVIPVDEDAYPLLENRARGVLRRFSPDMVIIELTEKKPFPHCQSLILGVLFQDQMKYVGILVQSRYQKHNHLAFIGELGGPIQDILEHDSIIPEFSWSEFQYTLPFPFELLDALADLGVLAREHLDRLLVCPDCFSLTTFRVGCPQCGSAKTAADRLIHHFACGYVGFVKEFETSEGLACPKCRSRHLVIGADYEYTGGAQRCNDCDWVGSQLKLVGHCMKCNARFPGREAALLDLFSFHAQRLDPLAFNASS